MKRVFALMGALLVAVAVTTQSVGSYQEEKTRQFSRGEKIVDIDKYRAMGSQKKHGHDVVHVSISNQDSVLFESKEPFTVVGFVQTYPEPTGLPNPFTRHCPIKSTQGSDMKWRASTGPPRGDQPEPVLKHLMNPRLGITYNSFLADAKGNPIDPHIEIVR